MVRPIYKCQFNLSDYQPTIEYLLTHNFAFKQVGGEQKCLPRSISFSNLNDPENEERSEDLWQYHLDELKRCRQEQVLYNFRTGTNDLVKLVPKNRVSCL
jgi:glutamate synthase domain-containing protein 3